MTSPLSADEKPGAGGLMRFVTFERALDAAVAAYWRNRLGGRRVADVPPKEARDDG